MFSLALRPTAVTLILSKDRRLDDEPAKTWPKSMRQRALLASNLKAEREHRPTLMRLNREPVG
jgi:hypothetical protein